MEVVIMPEPLLTQAERKKMGQLLQFILAQPEQAGASARFGSACLHQARILGLVSAAGQKVTMTAAGRAFLRRLQVMDPQEAFQAQHQLREQTTGLVDGQVQTLLINAAESPLGTIARLKDRSGQPFLPRDAVLAGERLATDFMKAHLQPRITQSYEPHVSSKGKGGQARAADLSDTAMSARMRVNRAVDAMGPELAGVALDLCCFSKGLETIEQERQWPVRSAKLMLRTALLALHRHYHPPAAPAKNRAHHWGEDGYRPDL
jgi:Domain of unknown function (DUF6456)